MTDEPKKRKRREVKRKAVETIDFASEPEVHTWIVDRARVNHRTISAEIVHRLTVQKVNSEKGSKNLKHGREGDEV